MQTLRSLRASLSEATRKEGELQAALRAAQVKSGAAEGEAAKLRAEGGASADRIKALEAALQRAEWKAEEGRVAREAQDKCVAEART
jgi:hypothetical protein